MKRDYDKIKSALYDVRERGWGIVMPTKDELSITEPELVRQGAQYGIKIGAVAEAIHMVKTYIRTDVCPTVGTEEQTSEIIRQLSADYEGEPTSLLECKTFGKSLSELVFDGMNTKLTHMPDDARKGMGKTIERVINEGAAGLICILV
jgi:stage IV sporulation protein A